MGRFTSLDEYYCPYVEKNVVIAHETEDSENNQDVVRTNTCLNSHECDCRDVCKNKLLHMEIQLKRT